LRVLRRGAGAAGRLLSRAEGECGPRGASASPAGREFEIGYVDAESVARRLALIDAWSVPFEECMPVRGFPSYKGQRNRVGRWWTATTGSVVGYESWLERDWLMLLDFDPDVVGIAAQPFWLLWTTPEGKPCSPTDYFGYQRSSLRSDVIAGLTVWAVLVPESLAYATIAGVSPGVDCCNDVGRRLVVWHGISVTYSSCGQAASAGSALS
jgi:sulfate permease family protein